MDRELIKKVFHEPHKVTIERVREFANSSGAYKEFEKIFYIFFVTITGEVGVEPFIKNEKNKCFTPLHEDFLMSGERFVYVIIDNDFVLDVVTQDIINDDVLMPEELVQMLISERDKKDAEFIELLSERWSNNDISECL